MFGLGPGEIIGSIVFGRITDKYTHKTTVIINVIVLSVSFGLLIIYSALYTFSYPLAISMTLGLGF